MNHGINFIFGIHNHQPVGNFDRTFEGAYQDAYLPFVKVLRNHPGVRFALHMPGILWEWVEENQPEFFDIISKMLERDQVELMGGGFYEPILPMIPDSDKVGQIEKLNDYLVRKFNHKPTGMWLAERVWEPHLAKPIALAGIKYVCLDDSHFKMAGQTPEQLYGYYLTEECGHPVAVFPIDMKLRYMIPFMPPEKSIEWMREVSTPDSSRIIVLADDGEKFGVWPDTHHSVYEEGWLEKFCTLLEQNADWIHMPLFKEVIEEFPSLGTIYLPTASYTEMMEWALPAEQTMKLEDILKEIKKKGHHEYLRFIKGGLWRNYFAKYAESRNMQRKMLHVHDKIDTVPKNRTQKALDKLWTGQCNCAYWHGVFGGLYLNHLRTAIYKNLIEAENLIDEKIHEKKDFLEAEIKDFNRDNGQCLLLSNKDMNAYFDLNRGGALFEWDLREKTFNVLNTLTRRKEAYHRKLIAMAEPNSNEDHAGQASIHDIVKSKEEGLEKLLFYDWYRRSAFLDHFMGEDTTLDGFRKSEYDERGDFIVEKYEGTVKKSDKEVKALLERRGTVQHDWYGRPVLVKKAVTFPRKGLQLRVEYQITNESDIEIPIWFGVESNFAMQAGNTDDRYYLFPKEKTEKQQLGSIGEDENQERIGLIEEWVGFKILYSFSQKALLWRFPIETIQNSEAGFERSYQCSCMMPSWKFLLAPETSWSVEIKLKAEYL